MLRKITLKPLISRGRELAKREFDLEIPLELDDKVKDTAGHYDFQNDVIFMHLRFINLLCKKYENASLEEIINHTVCHETGHAYYSRELEEEGVFPYVVRISDRSIIEIENGQFMTNRLQSYIAYLINSIFDYPIDKHLCSDIGLRDPTAKIRAEEIPVQTLLSNVDKKEIIRRKMSALINLPIAIHDYEFGNIDVEARGSIKQNAIENLGEEMWDSTQALLSRLSADARSLRDTYPHILGQLFNLRTDWRSEKKEDICDLLPTFWGDQEYELLYINS